MKDLAQQKDLAWIGDSILGLYARRWILDHGQQYPQFNRSELFERMTRNQFLSALGEPTAVEATIGILYENDGLPAAFAYLETTLLPLFLKQINRAQPIHRKRHR
mgnify:CR=1 FL=1